MAGRGTALANKVKGEIARAKAAGQAWREEATTVVGGWLVTTTQYDDLSDDGATESTETWPWVDSLDEPDAGDELVFVNFGNRQALIGTLERVQATIARITRDLDIVGDVDVDGELDVDGGITGNSLTIGSISNTEFGYLDSARSNLQDQIDTKRTIGDVLKTVHVVPNGTTAITSGMTAPTLTATVTNDDDANGPWIRHETGASSGNASGVTSDFFQVKGDWLPDITIDFEAGTALSSIRYWVGLADASLDASADGLSRHVAAFRYDAGVHGSVHWYAFSNDGGGSSPTETDSGVTLATNTPYLFRIKFVTTANVQFWINGTLVATHTTNLPTSTTMLGYLARVTTLTAAVRRLRWSRIILTHK